MPSPFPGMVPYLEDRGFWPDVHHWLISLTVTQLQPQVTARGYYAAIESRIWLEKPEQSIYPDVMLLRPRHAVTGSGAATSAALVSDEPVRLRRRVVERRESYIQIHDAASRRLITDIEFLSPSNKSKTEARTQFIQKRKDLRRANVSLVEVDLLRSGRTLVDLPPAMLADFRARGHYIVNILRPRAKEYEFYPASIRKPLPRVGIPLRSGEPDVVLDLQTALARAYEEGAYNMRIDYNQPAKPALTGNDAAWADELLAPLRGASSRN